MDNQNGYYEQRDTDPVENPYEPPAQGPGTYGNPVQASYGSTAGEAGPYGQNPGAYGGNAGGGAYGYGAGGYGNPPYGMGGGVYGSGPVPENHFAMKLTFSILEMLSCNLITMIMGIIACVFTTKANNSHGAGRWQEFKSEAKTATICLWVGLGSFLAFIFLAVLIGIGMGAWDGAGNSASKYVFVDGERLDIPSDYDTYEDMGYYLGRSDRFETLMPDDHGLYQMRNADGDYVMWCWFENRGNTEEYVSDCDIIGVDVDIYCDNYEYYLTAEGLGFFDTKEDYIEMYGRPDNIYKEDYDDSELLCWYFGDKSDPVWQVMEVTFIDGLPYDIDVDYR